MSIAVNTKISIYAFQQENKLGSQRHREEYIKPKGIGKEFNVFTRQQTMDKTKTQITKQFSHSIN